MSSSPTYRQLAEWAGVSIATVSLALRNHPSLPKATRERIQKLAAKKGYHANPVVASLMTQLRASRIRATSEKIAFLTFWPKRDQWLQSENNRRYYEGAGRRAEQLGYGVEHFWAKEPGMSQTRLSRILHARGIRGVIASHLMVARGHISLKWEHFAGATIGYSIVRPALHRVTHAHYGAMQMALRHLRHANYRRIGYATLRSQDERVNNAWLGSYLAHGFPLPVESRVPPLLMAELTLKEFEVWLDREKPDAVVSNEPKVLELIEATGRRLPADIGFATLDLTSAQPHVAGIDQRADELGVAAMDVVIRQLQNNIFGIPAFPVSHQVEGQWRQGKTIRGRAPARAHAKVEAG